MLSTDPAQTRLREEVLSSLWKLYPQNCVILTDPGAAPRSTSVSLGRRATAFASRPTSAPS